nr:spectinomyin phosphotransferase [uncultured bacterium]
MNVNISDEKIRTSVQKEYGLVISQVNFLPIGADARTAVYRITTSDETDYFLKLRQGKWEETAVTLPKFLSDQGISQIIPPLSTLSGQLWGNLETHKMILYPFVPGHDAYQVDLEEHHWRELGIVLKRIHRADIPPAIRRQIRQETYAAEGREAVKMFLSRIETEIYADPIAIELAAFLQAKRLEILDLVARIEKLAQQMQTQPQDWVVCHSDLHAGNLYIGGEWGRSTSADWDEPILAPKERDLMYIGGGLLASGLTPQEEEQRFYPAYGPASLNKTALAYYRYERIIQDIMEYCKELLLSDEGGEDRAQSLVYLMSNFHPNGTIAIARQSDTF